MIIVRSKKDETEYILLGATYGMFRAQGPKGWSGIPSVNEGDSRKVALCNKNGDIFYVNAHEVYVVSVDGKNPGEIL